MNLLQHYITPVYQLFFPDVCEVCGNELLNNEKIACIPCLQQLAKTNFHLMLNNPMEQKFWGRIRFEYGISMYYFNKGNSLQYLLHALKYKGKTEIGLMMGRMFGRQVQDLLWLKDIDLLIPIPLWKQKLKMRGFNQSETIARGFAQYLQLKMDTSSVIRKKNTETQTQKSRSERMENVRDAFEVIHPELLEGKHILLLDDVVTTGATLESCANTILAIKGSKVSIATLAYAVE